MIAEKTGWTEKYIMQKVTWESLRRMLADAPAMKKVKPKPKVLEGDELAKILGM
ncbi:hypothetical protein [Pedobacter sp. D749]|uniref:hypothetical protein n=1 Tax=Pedobacter sp. D749 TaxID=2856523 RepID=UPI001C58E25F|nr:hypothetical protein [Pedobacter sp. D749]QXU42089.1 hypothetical protein KYH19_00350 [Pedobacter sp. D749]